MPKLYRELIDKAFSISDNKNLECIILVVTNVYGIGINNLDIVFMI